MRLLLDELYTEPTAEALRDRGHDVDAVTERPDLNGLSDAELFALMPAERRAIVTENWGDLSDPLSGAMASGTSHYGVVFTSRRRLPRSRDTVGLDVRVLDEFLVRNQSVDALINEFRWLPESSPPHHRQSGVVSASTPTRAIRTRRECAFRLIRQASERVEVPVRGQLRPDHGRVVRRSSVVAVGRRLAQQLRPASVMRRIPIVGQVASALPPERRHPFR